MLQMLHNVTGKQEEEEDKRSENLKEYITGKHWTFCMGRRFTIY